MRLQYLADLLPYGSPRFPASYFRRFLTLPYGDFSLHNRSQLIKLYETNRAVSTNRSFSSIPKKGTSGFQKKIFFPDLFLGGPREYYTEKWLKNFKKNSLVLGGLKVDIQMIYLYRGTSYLTTCFFSGHKNVQLGSQ
jgi:hypothetical protein